MPVNMSKRKRRSRRHRTPNLPAQAGGVSGRRAAESKQVSLAEEYAYVASDLGRIGLIAGVMFGVLIILSFIRR